MSRIEDSVALLLLPSAPSDASAAELRAAYGSAVTQVLVNSMTAGGESAQILDIAIHTEDVDNNGPRSLLYARHQEILAGVYSLIATTTAKASPKQAENSLDVRVIFVTDDIGTASAAPATSAVTDPDVKGPLTTLSSIASSTRPWKRVYALESEEGEGILQKFVSSRKSVKSIESNVNFEVCRVPGGPSMKVSHKSNEVNNSCRPHASIAVGGTFDHLHLGHKLLLSMTAFLLDSNGSTSSHARCITVGITGDELLKNKKYAEVLETWEERQLGVYRFLAGIISFDAVHTPTVERRNDAGPNGKAVLYTFDNDITINCVEISDPFGPTITDEAITALVVSGETRAGGEAVNEKRGEKDWAPLDVFEVGVLDAGTAEENKATRSEAFESKISSTEIRRRLHERAPTNE